jgi:DNA mismatch repair protein MutS
MAKLAETPLMKQHAEMKLQHPDAILLFRVGDFYETFAEDAVRASEILGITLTKRANGSASSVALAGFPHHALDTYLPKLVRAGARVAVCDQLENPKLTKKLVKRGITELITPGVSINDNVLNYKENNFLAAVHFERRQVGVAFLDISTGEFLTAEGSEDYIEKLIVSFQPKEILYNRNCREEFQSLFGTKMLTYEQEDWIYTSESATERLLKHFETTSLKGFGIENLRYGIIASGAILYYLDHTHHEHIKHISSINRIEEDSYMWLDRFTVRNLELYGSQNAEAKTLLDVLDLTSCPMGARMLKRWISFPLKNIDQIQKRHSIVEDFFKNCELRQFLEENIQQIGDLERIASKVAVGRVSPREVVQLKKALTTIASIKNAISTIEDSSLHQVALQLNPCVEISNRIQETLNEDCPAMINKGGVIRCGVNKELDELRQISTLGKDFLLQIQEREAERTQIPSLKIGYNNVFGYYIEVRNTHKDRVPQDWIRKQTLTQAERYVTQELKEYEEKILGAEEKIFILESAIYQELLTAMLSYISAIQINCNLIAQIDCLLSFSRVAAQNNYIRPKVDESLIIDIKNGRHPVIEQQLPIGESYIANDVLLDSNGQQIMMITGPNMAGKSALLRQTALIVLMAQIGSFVPADSATIGIVDKIFTRVGASDNISVGESTFMVEMNEAASILNNISARSLILFDELGRGTSTYDGISIAWAIVEYIHEHSSAKAKTLFATHYHELNEMAKSFSRVKNYNVSVKELDNKIVFLRKLEKGGSEHSFGIHVAKMAGMPKTIVKRANEILQQLESVNGRQGSNIQAKDLAELATTREGYQLSFVQLNDPLLESIRDEILNVNVDNLTPIDALNKLNDIKRILLGK